MSRRKNNSDRHSPDSQADIDEAGLALIDSSEELAEFCAHLSEQSYVTIDTEFIRDRTYWPRLCLIQAASAEQARAIDPLAPGIDLAPFFALLTNPEIVKVFHAARQDVEIFYHMTGSVPAPLFDTQIAAMVCGFGESVGYDRLVQVFAGAQIDKASRFTDWARRPLAPRQVRYALADVTYLQTIYRKLASQLEKSGRAHWLGEEMAVLTDPATYALDPELAWQRLKTRSRNPKYLGVVMELATWREREAQRRDMPRNHVLKDEGIHELAAERPSQPDGLRRLRSVPNSMGDSEAGKAILAAIQRGISRPPESLPRLEDGETLPKGLGPLTDLLKALLRLKCDEHGVAQKLIATVSDLELIAGQDEPNVQALRGWRREVFGEDALALKRGEVALGANGKQVRLVKVSGD